MGRKKKRGLKPSGPSTLHCKPSVSRRHLWAGAALCVLVLLAFSSSFQAGFAWDNKYLILQDPRIRNATPENVHLIFQHSYWWPSYEAGIYRPLTTLSYLFNYAILGDRDQPAGYHRVNVCLHLINVLLVYALASRLVRRFWPSVWIAAVWGVHPVLTESVTNIIGRSDLLAAAATLSGLLLYLKSTDVLGLRKAAWLAGLLAVTAAGVYSKENAVAIVGVIALYELAWWETRRQWRSLLLAGLAMLPPIALMLWQRSIVLAAAPPAEFPFTDNPIVGADFWTGRLTAVKVIAKYLGLIVWPARLSIDYSYAAIPLARGSSGDWLAWLAFAALVVVVAILYRRNRTACFFAGLAAVTFLPTANLLFPIGTIMAERLIYLPCAGVLACLVLALYAAGERMRFVRFVPAVLCLVTAAFTVRTWVRNLDWKDDLSLMSADVRTSPHSYKLHKVLASLLYSSDPSHANLDLVMPEAEKSLSIIDSLPDGLNDADTYRLSGGLYLAKGDYLRRQGQSGQSVLSSAERQAYERALKLLLRCVAISQADDRGRQAELARRGSPSRAVAAAEPEAYRLLGAVYLRLGDAGKALQAASQARSLNPLDPDAYRISAEVLLENGNADAAAVMLTEGVLLTSDNGLRERLLDLYRNGLDRQGCAIAQGSNGPSFDPACPLVHRHICAASVGVVKARLQRGQRDLAESQEKFFLRNFGCPLGPLEQALARRPAR